MSDTKKINPRIISLCSNNSLITAISNDFSYNLVFKKQLEYLGNKNDILITISSSGNSENIIQVIKYAKKNLLKLYLLQVLMVVDQKMSNVNLVDSNNYGIVNYHAYMNIIFNS